MPNFLLNYRCLKVNPNRVFKLYCIIGHKAFSREQDVIVIFPSSPPPLPERLSLPGCFDKPRRRHLELVLLPLWMGPSLIPSSPWVHTNCKAGHKSSPKRGYNNFKDWTLWPSKLIRMASLPVVNSSFPRRLSISKATRTTRSHFLPATKVRMHGVRGKKMYCSCL